MTHIETVSVRHKIYGSWLFNTSRFQAPYSKVLYLRSKMLAADWNKDDLIISSVTYESLNGFCSIDWQLRIGGSQPLIKHYPIDAEELVNYRIQKRRFSSNVIEQRITTDGKEHWKIIIVPSGPKELGDRYCEKLLNEMLTYLS